MRSDLAAEKASLQRDKAAAAQEQAERRAAQDSALSELRKQASLVRDMMDTRAALDSIVSTIETRYFEKQREEDLTQVSQVRLSGV